MVNFLKLFLYHHYLRNRLLWEDRVLRPEGDNLLKGGFDSVGAQC